MRVTERRCSFEDRFSKRPILIFKSLLTKYRRPGTFLCILFLGKIVCILNISGFGLISANLKRKPVDRQFVFTSVFLLFLEVYRRTWGFCFARKLSQYHVLINCLELCISYEKHKLFTW